MAGQGRRPAPDGGPAGNRALGTRAPATPDAGQRGLAPAAHPVTASVGTLVLFSHGFRRRIVDLYKEAHLDPAAVVVEYTTWAQMAAALSTYKSIDRLVVLGHTKPGMLLFNQDPRTGLFDPMPLDEAGARLNALSGTPQIRIVDLAGCNAGLDLKRVLQFGLAVGATQVLATNHYHEFQLARFDKGASWKRIEKDYRNLRDYITTPNIDTLVEQSKKRSIGIEFLLEWYVATPEEDQHDLPIERNLHSKEQADIFKPGSTADTKTVASPADLNELQEDFDRFGHEEPIHRLTSITLMLDGFRPPADAGVQPRPTPDGGQGAGPPGRPDRALPSQPVPGRPDGGSPRRPPTGRPGVRGRRLAADDPGVRAVPGLPGPERPPRALDQRDRAIVDEVFRRGGSVSDAMDVLATRLLDQGSTQAQRWLRQAPSPPPAARSRTPRFTLEDRGLLDRGDPGERLQSQLDELERARPPVQERFDAYLAATTTDFIRLKSASVKQSFEPITDAPYNDPYATRLEKYQVMRGAYYRAGWTCINRDVLDLIGPASFFGTPVRAGVHREMADVLRGAEKLVRDRDPKLAAVQQTAGFVISGFVPRLQAGSTQLSNHAMGLAIDIDPDWNPQLKSPAARAAFIRATGDDISRSLYPASSIEVASKAYTRVTAMSRHLQDWLHQWLPQYLQLARQRADAAKDPKGKQKVASIDKQIASGQDLSAVAALVKEYSLPTVQSWAANGIATIPPQVIQAFLDAGRQNGASWGGLYEKTKDFMHLELVKLARHDSLARPGGPGLRKAVAGFDDLRRGDPPPAPDCGPRALSRHRTVRAASPTGIRPPQPGMRTARPRIRPCRRSSMASLAAASG